MLLYAFYLHSSKPHRSSFRGLTGMCALCVCVCSVVCSVVCICYIRILIEGIPPLGGGHLSHWGEEEEI